MNHNIVTSSTKVYLRFKNDHPDSQLMASAFEGFLQLGAEVVPFYWVDDIDEMKDLGPETFVCGYIGDIFRSLQKMGKPIPEPLDYPEALHEFLGRKIYQSTLGEVRNGVERVFIKPIEHKLFTGFVFDGSWASKRRVVTVEDSTPVWVSECIEMDSEYRCVVLNGDIIDVRRYKGNWALAPQREVVEKAVQSFELSGKAPACYTLDFAVNSEGTVLVEANDGFAFGHYGMAPVAYASCLAARLMQLASG